MHFPSVSGATKLQIRSRADLAGVLPRHPRREGRRAELEEVHLQGDLATRRSRPRVLQITKLPRTVGVNIDATHNVSA